MTTQPPGHESGRNLDAEALSRVLDGRDLHPDADVAEREAHERAEDDIAALRRALLLIVDTLAEPAAVAPIVAAAAPTAEEDEDRGAVVLPFVARLRAKAPILAAAASLVAVVGLGFAVVGTGGSDNDATSVAQQPAADVPAAAAPEAYAGGLSSGRSADTATAADEASATEAAAAPKAAKAEKSEKESAPAAGTAESLSGEVQADTAPKSPAKSTKKDSASALDTAVSCSRAIFVGTVFSIVPSGDGFRLTVLISDAIAQTSTGLQTYVVGQNYLQTPSGREDLTMGREFLFVIPQSTSAAAYGFVDPTAEDRKQVDAARERADGADC
ncbi:MAG: hypothetical protein ACT4QG_23135 [Sporichthyaceae bacterium]